MSDFKPMSKLSQLGQEKKEKSKGFGSRPSNGNFGKTPSKRMKRSVIKKKPTKVKKHEIIDYDYMEFVATFLCAITHQRAERGAGVNDIHVHHIDTRNGGRNDYNVVALIGFVHSWGDKAYHNIAKSDFMEFWFTDANLFDGHKYNDPKEYFREVSLMINDAYLSRYCWDIHTKKRIER